MGHFIYIILPTLRFSYTILIATVGDVRGTSDDHHRVAASAGPNRHHGFVLIAAYAHHFMGATFTFELHPNY